MALYHTFTLWLFNIAMENGPFLDDEHDDLPKKVFSHRKLVTKKKEGAQCSPFFAGHLHCFATLRLAPTKPGMPPAAQHRPLQFPGSHWGYPA